VVGLGHQEQFAAFDDWLTLLVKINKMIVRENVLKREYILW
jgi:hypothetical protein